MPPGHVLRAPASLIDDYVEGQVLDALHKEDGLLAHAVDASDALEVAARAVAEAEHELDLFVTNPKLLYDDRRGEVSRRSRGPTAGSR